MNNFLNFSVLLLISTGLNAQNVGINATGAAPKASAILDVDAVDKGVLVPRISISNIDNSGAEVNAPETSLLIYNSNGAITNGNGSGYYYWDGSQWSKLFDGVSNDAWELVGNSGTTAGTNFIGTTDAIDFVIKTNNVERMRVESGGFVGVGINNPTNLFHVQSSQSGLSNIYSYNTNTSLNSSAVYGEAVYNAYGWLGKQGGAGLGGAGWNLSGREIGVLGISDGGSVTDNYGVVGLSNFIGVFGESIGSYGILGISSANYGVYGYSSGSVGVRGYSTVAGGVWGTSIVGNDFGVIGNNTNATGTGVVGAGNNLGAQYAGVGSGGSFTGSIIGTYSYSQNTNAAISSTGIIGRDVGGAFTLLIGGAGVTGSAAGDGSGVYAHNTGTSATSHGLYSDVSSTTANAIFGNGGNDAVYGQTSVTDGVGVRGYVDTGNDNFGTYGFVNNSGNRSIGGYGYAPGGGPNRYGGFFDNDLGCSGTKSFVIDHPQDPSNKILKHYCTESPEIINLYRGNIVLNNDGEAAVKLPNYFHAVNNDNISYNLTCIGKQANIYIKEEVVNGQFVIAGGISGQKVSWTVYAERNDPYLQKYPEERAVEIAKTGNTVGKYLQPNLYGQPLEKGIHYKELQLSKNSITVEGKNDQNYLKREEENVSALTGPNSNQVIEKE